MFIVVWTGRGFVIPLIGYIGLMAGDQLSQRLPEALGFFLGLLLAAGLNFLFSKWLGKRARPRLVKDVKTGQLFYLRAHSTLFFISARYWTWIFAIAGAFYFAVKSLQMVI
jgi:hypothetical protein